MREQQCRIVLQGEAKLIDCGRGLLLTLSNEAKVEMRFSQVRLEPQGLIKRRGCTFQIAFLGEPYTLSVINSCRRRACRRVRSRCRRFARVRQLRRGQCGDK
jgi:hypothetical protein